MRTEMRTLKIIKIFQVKEDDISILQKAYADGDFMCFEELWDINGSWTVEGLATIGEKE